MARTRIGKLERYSGPADRRFRELLAAVELQEKSERAKREPVRCGRCGDVLPAGRSCDCWDYSTIGGVL